STLCADKLGDIFHAVLCVDVEGQRFIVVPKVLEGYARTGVEVACLHRAHQCVTVQRIRPYHDPPASGVGLVRTPLMIFMAIVRCDAIEYKSRLVQLFDGLDDIPVAIAGGHAFGGSSPAVYRRMSIVDFEKLKPAHTNHL